jgi:thioredoxin reductase
MDASQQYDVVVVGGGPAGLQAALTLGRMRRSVLVLDSGEYRNAAATQMHNFLTHDGASPAAFRAAAREGLRAYDTVEVRDLRADAVTPTDTGWRVALAGGASVSARKVLLATGLRDTLPEKPGLADLWGDVVAHCPYCHGHEFSGRPIAVLGGGPRVARLSLLMSRIASRITVLTDGADLDADTRGLLDRPGVDVREEPVVGVCRSSLGATIELTEGTVEVAGLFVSTELAQAAPFAEQLGLEMLPSGCVRVDELGRTSRPGVYAAGDLAHLAALPMPLASVLTASAAGLLTATAADQDLVAEDYRLPTPA